MGHLLKLAYCRDIYLAIIRLQLGIRGKRIYPLLVHIVVAE